jgi:orotate phosphoribosyltransferase
MSESVENKTDFVEFLISNELLKVDRDFTYKSGREGPYFLKIGTEEGEQAYLLARYYAEMVKEFLILNPHIDNPVLFGPAYKGIPIVVSASIVLYAETGKSLRYCYNRKEEKDHGDGGKLEGYKPQKGDNVIIVEDVTTAGSSIDEVSPFIVSSGANLVAVLTAVDRMEFGKVKRASLEIAEKYNCKYQSIMDVAEVMNIVRKIQTQNNIIIDNVRLDKIRAYFKEHAPDALDALDD